MSSFVVMDVCIFRGAPTTGFCLLCDPCHICMYVTKIDNNNNSNRGGITHYNHCRHQHHRSAHQLSLRAYAMVRRPLYADVKGCQLNSAVPDPHGALDHDYDVDHTYLSQITTSTGITKDSKMMPIKVSRPARSRETVRPSLTWPDHYFCAGALSLSV